MKSLALVSVLGLAACGGRQFETVQEACRGDVPGASQVQGAASTFERVDCYRNFLGLSRLRVAGGIVRASEGQTAWWEAHDTWGDSVDSSRATIQNSAEDPGYTGRDPRARAVAQGMLTSADDGKAVMERILSSEPDGDRWIADPWVRDVLFQPGLFAVGAASVVREDDTHWLIDGLVSLPVLWSFSKPVVWPADGVEDIPTTWAPSSGLADDPAGAAPRGYPVTVTLAASVKGNLGWNPYGLSGVEATLWDSQGQEVESLLRLPSILLASAYTSTTLVLIPTEPLKPGEVYDFKASGTGVDGAFSVESRFTTAD